MSQYRGTVLLIDIGNSFIKWRFKGQDYSKPINKFSIDMLPDSDDIWVSCVAHCDILDGLDNTNFVSADFRSVGLECAYNNPEELGVDRYLALVAVNKLYSNTNVAVIDIGSAVTFDVLLSTGVHEGGLIMPGLLALRRSFDKFSTSNDSIQSDDIASSTVDAWLSGTSVMLLSAIKAQIKNYNDKYKNLVVALTGGDAEKVLPHLSGNIKHHNNLVLDGLGIYAQSTINQS
jgi:type III pantothenate kinase